MLGFELLVVLLLVLLNGFFAMSELALVSARKPRLKAMAEAGDVKAAAALHLSDEPGRFLSTVQIGITLIGILAGAFSGATFADKLGDWFDTFPALAGFGDPLALGLVVVALTFLSLILGELVPKQLALRNAEAVAKAVAKPMRAISLAVSPAVFLLDAATNGVLRLFGARQSAESRVTEEEIRTVIAEATRAGVVLAAEKDMITGVMRLADRPARSIMTPRPDVVWLDLDDTPEEVRRKIAEAEFSRFPVAQGRVEEVRGVVQTKDLLDRLLRGGPLDLKAALQEAPVVHEATPVLAVIDILRASPLHMALVVDEYGGLEGLVTATDILEAIVGELAAPDQAGEAEAVRRDDGSWLMDGGISIDRLKDLMGFRELPGEDEYHTLAGFALHQLARIPNAGEHFDWSGFRFEVVDMDGRRIDKVLVTPPQQTAPDESAVG
jgi:putative hemolysin